MGKEGLMQQRAEFCGGCGRRDGDAKLRITGRMDRGLAVRMIARTALLSWALALCACSMPDFGSMRLPDTETLLRPQSVTNFRDRQLGPVTAADLVDSSGRCAEAFAAADAGAAQSGEPGGPTIASGISLEMTECDVVKRAGVAQAVDIGSEAGERVATLTYSGGPRPGVYRFVGGRLKTMERGPEPPPQQRPQRRAPPKRTADTAR
jgi:hypothetical protein